MSLFSCFFGRVSQGSLFMNMWTRQGKQEQTKKGSSLNFDEVLENVWLTVYPAWKKLGRRIAEGDITFKEFQDHFEYLSMDNLKEQLSCLQVSVDKKDWISERVRQVQEHRELEQCVSGANIIMAVVREYDLKGNFEPISMIVKMVIIYFLILLAAKVLQLT